MTAAAMLPHGDASRCSQAAKMPLGKAPTQVQAAKLLSVSELAEPISETVLEIPVAHPKRRRGRPPNPLLAAYREHAPAQARGCQRSRENGYLATHACVVLQELLRRGDRSCSWLWDPDLADRELQPFRVTVLAALGRLAHEQGDERAIAAAKEICEHRPTARRAVAFVTALRGARKPTTAATYDALLTALARTLDAFRTQHPEMPRERMLDALSELHALYSDESG